MSSLNSDRRRRLLETVFRWLDEQDERGELAELDEPEAAPAGIAPEVLSQLPSQLPSQLLPQVLPKAETAPDLFSLLSQLIALTRETQLQGRATNRLHTELGEALTNLTEQQSSLAPPDVIAQKLTEARREARSEMLAELLEVRDRFTRSLDEAERRLNKLSGLQARFGQRPVLEAVLAGNSLARERLDDLLRRLDVHEIACLDKPFDPNLMRAMEVSQASTAAPGTVLEIIRPGYTCNGRVLRFAEVKVVAGSAQKGVHQES